MGQNHLVEQNVRNKTIYRVSSFILISLIMDYFEVFLRLIQNLIICYFTKYCLKCLYSFYEYVTRRDRMIQI